MRFMASAVYRAVKRLGPLQFFWCWVPVCTVCGVPLQIHSTTFLFPWGYLLARGWHLGGRGGVGLVLSLLIPLTGSLLTHEFAHVFVAHRFGIKTRRVLLLPFGCVAVLDDVPPQRGEFWIAASGPAASALLAAVLRILVLGLEAWPGTVPTFVGLLELLARANLVLALFNLIPCFPMDGGRILRSLLTLSIGALAPCRAPRAQLIATRIAVRYVARTLALVWAVVTLLVTRFWWHLPMVLFLLLAGEAEFSLIEEDDPPASRSGEPRPDCGQGSFSAVEG